MVMSIQVPETSWIYLCSWDLEIVVCVGGLKLWACGIIRSLSICCPLWEQTFCGNEWDYRRREYEMVFNIQEISAIQAKHVAEIEKCNFTLWNALKPWNYSHRSHGITATGDMSPSISCAQFLTNYYLFVSFPNDVSKLIAGFYDGQTNCRCKEAFWSHRQVKWIPKLFETILIVYVFSNCADKWDIVI